MTSRQAVVFLACLLVLFASTHGQVVADGVKRCSTPFTQDGACAWTGDCSVNGCANRCVTDLGAGSSAAILQDRAFSETWYALCPRLANVVDIVVRATTPGATAGPAPQIATEQKELSEPETDGDAEAPDDANSRSLLTSGLHELDVSQDTIHSVALAVASSSPAAGLPGILGTLPDGLSAGATAAATHGTHRSLLDTAFATPSAGAEQQIERQACPSPETVKTYARFLNTLADEYSAVFQADAAGQPLTPAQIQLAPFILDKPNEFAVLVPLMREPQRLAAYVRDACTTSPVTGAAFPLYSGFLLDNSPPPPGASVVVCRDNFLGMEQHVRGIVDATAVCTPPFGELPDCFGTAVDIPLTPTSTPCATTLAAAYNISTSAPLASVANSLQSLQRVCSAAESEASCTAVDGTTQRNEIRHSWTMFPLRAPLPGSPAPSADVSAGSPPVLVLEGSDTTATPTSGSGGGRPATPAGAQAPADPLAPAAAAGGGGGGAGISAAPQEVQDDEAAGDAISASAAVQNVGERACGAAAAGLLLLLLHP